MRSIAVSILFLFVTPYVVAQAPPLQLGDPVRLLQGEYLQPRWSPDGSRIAFTADRYSGLWVMQPDGSDVQQITDEETAGFGFSWSADGGALLARVARMEGYRRYNAVKVFDLTTNEATQLTDYRTLMPALPQWAAAGEKVYLDNKGTLEVIDTGRQAASKQSLDVPVFFIKQDRIATATLSQRVVSEIGPLPEERVLNLVVSPDSSKMAFEVMGGSLHVMNTDGTGLVDLGVGHRPQWSPDSQWLVYMRTEDDGHDFTGSDLYAARVDGSTTVQLTRTPDRLEMNPSWSPDGKRIAYDDRGTIYVTPIRAQ